MKGIAITEFGGPDKLQYKEDLPDPKLSEGQILIDVKATALNGADLLQRKGNYPPPAGARSLITCM